MSTTTRDNINYPVQIALAGSWKLYQRHTIDVTCWAAKHDIPKLCYIGLNTHEPTSKLNSATSSHVTTKRFLIPILVANIQSFISTPQSVSVAFAAPQQLPNLGSHVPWLLATMKATVENLIPHRLQLEHLLDTFGVGGTLPPVL